MNPMTNMKNVTKLSEQELKSGLKTSWHDQYKDSSWIFVGGLPYDLTEGDVITVFSQYGEIVNINLIRDKKTGKQKGFCFVCYEDQRSTVLAVDNLNGIKILGKSIRVDHVQDYKPPKDDDRYDDLTRKLHTEGCAPKPGDPQFIMPENPIKRENHIKRERSPFRRDRSPARRERSPNWRDRSPIRRERSPIRRDRSPIRRDRSPIRREKSPNKRDRSPNRRERLDRSPIRREIKRERREESPIRHDIKREESRTSYRDRSPRRRSRSNERKRRDSSSDRSDDGKHRHHHKKSSKKKDRKKRKRRSSTSSSESN